MGIALLALVDLLSPLQSLANRWMPTRPSSPDGAAKSRRTAACPARGPRAGAGVEADLVPPHVAASPRPLRVVRTVDAQRRGGVTGRLVLSGRLVDVCAELDRLAALEAAELSRSAGTLHSGLSAPRKGSRRSPQPAPQGAMPCVRLHAQGAQRRVTVSGDLPFGLPCDGGGNRRVEGEAQ